MARKIRLIVIDGLDAVGKDTHAELIKKRYEKLGERVVVRSHPEDDNFLGRRARVSLLGSGWINRIRVSVFYVLDVLRSLRFYYREDVCDTLIMVRYLMGTAYLPFGWYRIAYNFFEKLAPTSSYMFFLDAPPEVLLKRIKSRERREMFETLDSLVRVRRKALKLAVGWNIVDTSFSVEETYGRLEGFLDRLDADF